METTRSYQLLVDFDSHNRIKVWLYERKMQRRLEMLSDVCYVKVKHFNKVKSNHGYHYYIMVISKKVLMPKDLLFIQAYIGDDEWRSVFNFNRILLGWKWSASNVLFKENEKR